MRFRFVFVLSFFADCTRGKRGSDNPASKVVEVQRLPIPRLKDRQIRLREFIGAALVRIERIGQLLDYRNRRTATARLRLGNGAIPHGPSDGQRLAGKISPSQTAKLRLAHPSKCRREYNRVGWLRQHSQHGFNFREAVSVGVLLCLWNAGNAHVLNRVDTVEDAQALRLFETAREERLAMTERRSA